MNTIENMQRIFALQKTAADQQLTHDAKKRQEQLNLLLNFIKTHETQIQDEISLDFGNRSKHETLTAEIMTSCEDLKHTLNHFKKWMRPESVSVPFWQKPGSAKIMKQAIGVVGIIVPWNYPLFLAIGPLSAALAAGNRVMIKMSEFTPHFSEYFKKSLSEIFPEEEIAVITGDSQVAQEFSSLAFDHILFTGSTSVGRHVMRAAAENLTPVTLELGGKSPTLVTDHFSIKVAAERIIFGKLCNAGQTCIAPDYVLVPKQKVTEFIKFAQEATASMYPTLENNPDYTSIINNRQKTRLQSYVDEASVDPTNKVIPLHTEALPPSSRKLTPSIVMGSSELKVFADEIFGPILPIVPYDTLDEAISYINARPKPLALYAFSDNQSEIDQILNNTISGGVTINDIFHHLLSNNLPFGGVGPSGMGHYHGKSGFDTFSKQKGVFKQSRFNAGKMLYPPYTKLHERVMRFIIG